jgi:cell division protein FtsQ
MTRIAYILTALLLSGYLVIAFVSFYAQKQDTVCRDIQVVIRESPDKRFIEEQDILSMLKRAQIHPAGQRIREIDTEGIERELMKNAMVLKAEAYKTPSGAVKIEVRQRTPVLRVCSVYGDYYVDAGGGLMPVSRRYAAYVPLASGYVEKRTAMTDLYKFALFLRGNEFWNDQIEQIYIHADREVELVPRAGNHRILLGSFENFEEKLANLALFYEQAIPRMGWNKYSVINLKFKNQIVCTNK